jgi:hypothetical protein
MLSNAAAPTTNPFLSRSFIREAIVSGLLPWIIVVALQSRGIAIVPALAISAVLPIGDGIFSFVRKRRIDALGIVNLALILGSIGISLVTGDVHVILLKGAALTAIFSLACLGSLLTPKPLMFWLGRQFTTGNDPTLVADWDTRWERPRYRKLMRVITAVWGVGYFLEVFVRLIAAYTLLPVAALGSAPVISYGVLGLLVAWTIAYSSVMRRKDPSASIPSLPG